MQMARFESAKRHGRDSASTHALRELPPRRRPRSAIGIGFAWFALSITLGGCTVVGPQFVKPDVTVNPAWTKEGQDQFNMAKAADAAWWRTFNDPVLDKLIDQAWQENLTVRAAALRIAESRAQLALAVGQQWPQVQQAFGELTAVGLSRNLPNSQNFDRNFTTFQAGFDVAWEIDFWGKYKNLERSEAAHYFSTIADYDSALVTLSAEVARTYTVIRTYQALIDVAQKNVSVQQEGYRIADARHRFGATSELDVTQALTLLESTRESIPRYQLGLQQAQNALSTLLGQPVGRVQALLGGPGGVPAVPANAAIGMPAELLRRRPDIRSAEFAALQQSARVGVATADLYPRISLVGTIGVLATNGSSSLSHAGYYSLGPQVYLPIFDYDRTKNSIRIEDARLQQLLVNYQDVVLRAQQEAEDGVTGVVRSHEVATFAQNAANSAQRSSDLSFVQYREGAVEFQRVLDSMRALLQEQTTFVQAQSDTATNLISLYKALGGGWEMHQDRPVIPDKTRDEMEHRVDWGDLLSKSPPSQTLNVEKP
jgi:NodT family efflux transporter outer membrane factor (OMF) lipoprotein